MMDQTDTSFMEGMRSRLEIFEKRLQATLDKYRNYRFYEPLFYAMSGGKRLRPLLLLLSFECVGGKGDEPFPVAVAVEFLHAESLIHDDIIDQSKFRRKKLSFNKKYGYDMTILSSDFLLAVALETISNSQKNSLVSKELAKASLVMCEGELEEIEYRKGMSWETYIRIVESKTASLFEVSAKLGAMLGEGDEEEVRALSMYGRFFGIAYQLLDDIVDWKTMGKSPITLLPLDDLDSQVNQMMKTALNYIEDAKRQLETLKKSEARHCLLKMPGLLIENLTISK